MVANGAMTNYAASDTNQYRAINGVDLGYDGNENLTEHNGWRYTYDAHGIGESGVSQQILGGPLGVASKHVGGRV